MTRNTDTVTDELLQRYHDGELSAEERADVEARLDSDALLRLAALEELGGLLRAHAVHEAASLDLSSTIAAVTAAHARGPVVGPQKARARTLWPASAVGVFAAGALALFFFFRPLHQSNDAHIESLEVTGSMATVMQVPDESDPGHTITVIWASLEDEPEGGGTL